MQKIIDNYIKLVKMKNGNGDRLNKILSQFSGMRLVKHLQEYDEILDRVMEDLEEQVWRDKIKKNYGYDPYREVGYFPGNKCTCGFDKALKEE